jgi:hypothetical protein
MWFVCALIGVVAGDPDKPFDPRRFAAHPWVPVVVQLLIIAAAFLNAAKVTLMDRLGWSKPLHERSPPPENTPPSGMAAPDPES